MFGGGRGRWAFLNRRELRKLSPCAKVVKNPLFSNFIGFWRDASLLPQFFQRIQLLLTGSRERGHGALSATLHLLSALFKRLLNR